jgi:hypothetical protein
VITLRLERVGGLTEVLGDLVILTATAGSGGEPLLGATARGALGLARDPDGDRLAAAYPMTIVRYEEGRWRRSAPIQVDLAGPHLQLLSGGDVLIVGSNSTLTADGAQPNAAVYGADGQLRRRFLVGDGVEDVQAGGDDSLWVAYDMLGTTGDYGVHGWGRLGPERWIDPMGYSGLVSFASTGAVRTTFTPPSGYRAIVDCFALNVWGASAWATYHPGFPIVRVHRSGDVSAWASRLGRVTALAVAGDTLLLVRRIPGDRHAAWLARLRSDQTLEVTATVELSLDGAAPLDDSFRVVARGPLLHAFGEASCYSLDLSPNLRPPLSRGATGL